MMDAAILAALEAAPRLIRRFANDGDMKLRRAPELDRWLALQLESGFGLMGWVTGHPVLGDDRWIRTSALIAIVVTEAGPAPLNRFYRLKRPFGVRRT